jgi:hypothetical protein
VGVGWENACNNTLQAIDSPCGSSRCLPDGDPVGGSLTPDLVLHSFEVRGPHFDQPRFYRRAAQVLKPDDVVVLADIAFADREEARFWASRINSPPQTARLES